MSRFPLPAAGGAAAARSLSSRVLVLAIASALVAPVWAQSNDSARRDTVYLSPLTSEAEADESETKPSESRISADEIATFGSHNLDDALRARAGTFTRDNPQNPGVAVNIRGLEGSGRVAMSIDGVRQNFRFTGHEAQGFAYVDPALLAGVDIRRGTVTTNGGAGALAGSANFRTLGVDDVVGADRGFGGFVNLGWGSNGGGFAPVAAAGLRTDRTGLMFAVSDRTPGSYRNADGQKVHYTAQDLTSGLAKFQFQLADDHRLELSAMRYENQFLANSYNQEVESTQYTGRWAWTPDSDLIDLRLNLYRSSVLMSYDRSPFFRRGGIAQGRRIRDTGTGFDLYNTSHFGEHVSSTYGVEYFRDRIDSIHNIRQVHGLNPNGRNRIVGIFSDTTLRFGIAEFVLGLRYDRYGVEGKGAVTEGSPVGMPAGAYVVDRDEGHFSPKLTFALNPVAWWQPYLTWSRSFRPPTVSELLVGGVHPDTTGPSMGFFPNPFLKPEKSKGWELGNRFSKEGLFTGADRLHVGLSYFRNEISDYVTAILGRQSSYFGNHPGTSVVKGLELEGGYDAGFLFAGLSYTDTDSNLPSQINGLGAQSYLPERIASLTLGGRFFEQRLSVGTRWSHVSKSYIGEINNPNDPWEPGYNLVDLFSNYVFDNGMEVRLNVSNLLDKAYTPALSTSAISNPVDTGRGRTWTVNLRIPF